MVFLSQKKNHVKLLLESELEVDFGEVLGKHSEVCAKIKENEIIFVSDSQDVIDIVELHGLENGFNPFLYTAINTERELFDDLTIIEIVEILEKEELNQNDQTRN